MFLRASMGWQTSIRTVDSTQNTRSKPELTTLQVLTLILSIYVLITLLIQSVVHLSSETNALLDQVDFLVCMVFLMDFAVSFSRAQSKLQYLKWGWIDLVSSIPMLDAFRVGRAVRIIRILRVLRAVRSTRRLMVYFLQERKGTSIAALVMIALTLLVFSAVAVLQLENAPDSNIKTPEDAIWWAYSTITTVGYGDKYPVTAEGRIVAVLLMTIGVGLFVAVTGFLASLFVGPDLKKEDSDIQQLTKEIRALRQEVEKLKFRFTPHEVQARTEPKAEG